MPYTSKNIDSIYAKSFMVVPECGEPFEDTPEDYLRWITQNSRAMGYAVKTTKAGPYLECEWYPKWKSSRDVPRTEKHGQSSKEQADLNDKNAKKNFCRKINANFVPWVDYWGTFTVDDEHIPQDEKAAARIWTNFIARAKDNYRRAGITVFKYAYTVEYKPAKDKYKRPILGQDGKQLMRPHWHLIVTGGFGQKELQLLWKDGGITHCRLLQPSQTGFTGLAKYITKTPRDGCRRFATSQNLIMPKQTVAMCHKAATKRKAQTLARDASARADFFEKLYMGKYAFVDCNAKYNKVNDGVYLYCRMKLKTAISDGEPVAWGVSQLWEE